MKFTFVFFLFFWGAVHCSAQTLTNYINEAKKKYSPTNTLNLNLPKTNTTSLQFGYFINPQYTISGAQRAYAEFQQEIPWLGKGASYRKTQKYNSAKINLQKQYEIEELSYNIKECYYKMYQYKKQKNIYVAWAENIRKHIASFKKTDSISIDIALKNFEYESQLIDITKKLQLVDGDYQNKVIVFNELLKSEKLDEPNLPVFLAMPEEETELQFPDPFESSSYLSFENDLLQQKELRSIQNPWSPSISLGLRYSIVTATENLNFELPNKDIFEPQLKLQWNLFSKKPNTSTKEEVDLKLDQKLSTLGHQLQTAINNQISARIAYDSATLKVEKIDLLKNKLNTTETPLSAEKILQIKGLKYTFELEQVKAVADYYISTSKMLLFF